MDRSCLSPIFEYLIYKSITYILYLSWYMLNVVFFAVL